jgi:hypothetical protein
MIRQDPDERITCTELYRLPLFQDVNPRPFVKMVDCLAPPGRQQMRSAGLTTDVADNNAEETTGSNFPTEVAAKEMTLHSSTTLIVVHWNLRHGFLPLPQIPPRYSSTQKLGAFQRGRLLET